MILLQNPELVPIKIQLQRAADVSSASSVYEGYKAQRSVLGDQLNELTATRRQLLSEIGSLRDNKLVGPSRTGLEERIGVLDKRIAGLDQQISESNAYMAKAAAVPGAVIQPALPPYEGPPAEAFVMGGLFMVVVLLPLSLALARRIWRRGSNAVAAIPSELMARLGRIEQAVDASAVEIERIGEGQRFITRLFSESRIPALPSNKDKIS